MVKIETPLADYYIELMNRAVPLHAFITGDFEATEKTLIEQVKKEEKEEFTEYLKEILKCPKGHDLKIWGGGDVYAPSIECPECDIEVELQWD